MAPEFGRARITVRDGDGMIAKRLRMPVREAAVSQETAAPNQSNKTNN